MPLPKCVKVDLDDKRSRGHLESEGWRQIGALLTYKGRIYRHGDSRVSMCRGEDILELAAQIEWSGLLWKDPMVPEDECWEDMRDFLLNNKFHTYRVAKAGFIVCDASRVHLIGVHPVAGGLGLAVAMIRSHFDTTVWAGTYADNGPAKKLYKSLDMEVVKQQAVFHK